MQASKEFTGLTMPVFSAFGWAGEENALKYALSQLQLFIESLYLRLPADARDDLPAFGLSAENQNVYLAVSYTHLDVYKRQVLRRPSPPRFAAQIFLNLDEFPARAGHFLARFGLNPAFVRVGTARPDLLEVVPTAGGRRLLRVCCLLYTSLAFFTASDLLMIVSMS